MRKNQHGIAHLGLVLLVLVVAVVAYAGYKVVKDNSTSSNNTASTTATNTVQTIKTKADLTTAENNLNSQNISGDLNPGQFDQDVNSLL